jgi:tRNA (guanine6-N2)-methyltransferase
LHVRLDTAEADALAYVATMRSIHKVVRPLLRLTLPEADVLATIRAQVAALTPTIVELHPTHARFRVTSARTGALRRERGTPCPPGPPTHDFTSEDVEREAGAGVRDVLPRAVSLKAHDVELRCDVRGNTCLIGLQVPGPALSRRPAGAFRPTVTLRASVAWGLLELARPSATPSGRVPRGSADDAAAIAPPAVLLDPFVGAGTILAEAATRWPDVALHGSDLHATAAEGAKENLGDRAEIRLGDARELDAVWPDKRFDTIVCNPPFGRRLGKEVRLDLLYGAFLAAAGRATTEDARMVVLVENRGAFNVAIRSSRVWRTAHVRVFEMGGVYVGAFVLERVPTA